MKKEELLEKTKVSIKKDIKKYSVEEIVEEINNIIQLVTTNYNEVIYYIKSRIKFFDLLDYSTYTGTSNVLFGWIEEVEKDLKRDSSKEQAIESYRMIIKVYKRSCELNESILNKERKEEIKEKGKRTKKESTIQNNDVIVEEDNIESYYDEDTEDNSDIVYKELENWQKEEVDKGNYDSYNFEEEELEEDDYYYEDDDK